MRGIQDLQVKSITTDDFIVAINFVNERKIRPLPMVPVVEIIEEEITQCCSGESWTEVFDENRTLNFLKFFICLLFLTNGELF